MHSPQIAILCISGIEKSSNIIKSNGTLCKDYKNLILPNELTYKINLIISLS